MPEKASFKIFGVKEENMEDEIERDIVLNNMSMTWNDETKCFFSDGDEIEILQMGKEILGKKLKGKFEIQRDRISDIITLYFKHPYNENDEYYFFRFSKNRVNFFTNNEEIMNIYKEMKEKGENLKTINGVEYEMRIPSELMIKAFLLKYY